MSLSDQIKQPGQIIGSGGGGGGGSTDAGDLTTGTLAAARLPGVLANVDTQAELLSAAAAAAASHTHAASDIASGTVATARLGSGTADNTTFLRGDQTWAAPSDATKLPLAGGTMTGAISFSGSISSAGSSTRNIHGNGNANDIAFNVPSTGTLVFSENGNRYGYLDPSGCHFRLHASENGALYCAITYSSSAAYYDVDGSGGNHIFRNNSGSNTIVSLNYSSPGGSIRSIHGNGGTTDLYANVPTGGVWGVSVNGNTQATIGASGLQFPTAQTQPANGVAIYNAGQSLYLQAKTDTYATMGCATLGAIPRIYVAGASASTYPGAVGIEPAPVSLAAAGTRTVMTSATTRSGSVEIMNTTDGKRATFSVENGTPVKIEGDATFVAGAPGASQIGLELSSTTLRINNGYAGAKLIAFIARLA